VAVCGREGGEKGWAQWHLTAVRDLQFLVVDGGDSCRLRAMRGMRRDPLA
jgi:hypothetical protein